MINNITYMINSPLDQFIIIKYFILNLSMFIGCWTMYITNIAISLSLAALLILALMILPNYNNVVNNKWSIMLETLYATIHSIVRNQINEKKGQRYFPFIFVLFIFILINNLIGMVPYSFASTSHFILTFALSFTIVLGVTILGFLNFGLGFFSLLVPAGCPLPLLPLLVLIEFISYLARKISLGLRLAANILSGHMLLNILAGFTYKIMKTSLFILGLLPLVFIIAFSGLELGIAFIQAQVFIVLSCSYIKNGLDLH